jgi:hypothetical protein
MGRPQETIVPMKGIREDRTDEYWVDPPESEPIPIDDAEEIKILTLPGEDDPPYFPWRWPKD